jgi:hypothetical protein
VVYTGNWQSKDYAPPDLPQRLRVCNSKRYGITIHLEGRVKIETNRIVFIDNDEPARAANASASTSLPL